jgi:hypothetical protein
MARSTRKKALRPTSQPPPNDFPAEFAKMEQRLAETNPGIMEILRVYGGYEEAIRQADWYLSSYQQILQPSTSTSDCST